MEREGLHLDISEFHLMTIVQTCCLAGVVVKGHKDLHNLVYLVSKLGGAEQLKLIHNHKRPDMLN
jgi:hypothetical protein